MDDGLHVILALMKPRVYLETTIISYLTARPSRDVVVAAHQELTRQWWETRSGHFDLLVSELAGYSCPVICTPEQLMEDEL